MTTDDDETALRGYIESLPVGHRLARDRAGRRQRVVASLTAHADHERKRVRRRRVMRRGAAALLTACFAVAAWLALPREKTASLVATSPAVTIVDGALLLEPGTPRTLRAGESVAVSDVGALEAPPGDAVRFRVSDIVAVTLRPAARVRVVRTSKTQATALVEAVALERGRAHFDVKKLGDTRRFHVLTPDADVEVRGTSFDVELHPGRTPGTCVSVEEGVVWIASGLESRVLARGESWGCNDGSTASVERAPAPSSVPPKNSNAGSSPPEGSPAGHARDVDRTDPSDLRAQNELFQSALAAERAGRLEVAASTYRRLVARAPRGSLAAQARANLAAISAPQR